MCGRFTSLLSQELLAAIWELFGVSVSEAAEPRYNIAPTQNAWVVRNEGDHNRLDLMKWGLVPFWSKDPSIGSRMINARCETVAEKPAFRQAIKLRRCIVPAAGFYEWAPPAVEGGRKQPLYIHMADASPMFFAGLWEQWKRPGEEGFLESFAIITTKANELVLPLHDRMPVILQPNDFGLWLSHNMHDPEQLREMYQPLSAKLLEAYKVSDLVNNVRFDSPACIARV
ncbi:MAG: SOS response-associated peptidase [Oryzomonas sp.]|uniref:SOS response-associated peptidase n=1 Tax=Oryzomonas sp. TaxID=2855186 RepID=UPI00284AD3CC|nr:SOS response-associated peptidase [Oryzomonas sp.]MDR3578686.1 SOS response-associated peptidase [Oryzomonas sp.]